MQTIHNQVKYHQHFIEKRHNFFLIFKHYILLISNITIFKNNINY